MIERKDGRRPDQLRPINVIPGFVSSAEASFLIEVGRTRVLCNATVSEDVPRWLKGKGKGWVTAEYSLLPRSTRERVNRERNSIGGRTHEIQRLIGRALRGVCDLSVLGERQIIIDCDVLEADGGTRTTSIIGGFMALAEALKKVKPLLVRKDAPVLKHWLNAVSVGIVDGQPVLDLNYDEDSAADVDMNVIMTDKGDFVEVQGTGEESIFSRDQLNAMLDLALKGSRDILEIQKRYVGAELP